MSGRRRNPKENQTPEQLAEAETATDRVQLYWRLRQFGEFSKATGLSLVDVMAMDWSAEKVEGLLVVHQASEEALRRAASRDSGN